MLKLTTAGESHGQAILAILEGVPYGLKLKADDINKELARRQTGFGRGGRMKIETDKVEILGGLRGGKTLGSPIALLIKNKDWKNWQSLMSPDKLTSLKKVTCPRPGHADLAGLLKLGSSDIRDVLERASARETAARVAAGAAVKVLLKEFGVDVLSHVVRIGERRAKEVKLNPRMQTKVETSPVRCLDRKASLEMVEEIKKAAQASDTLGGIFEVVAFGLPPGLGSYMSWETRLDGRIAWAVMSIPAIKGVEIGDGFWLGKIRGSLAHDEIFYSKNKGFYRKTNRAGGIEGGMTNGEPVIVRAVMKPIPTLRKPLSTVDIKTKQLKGALKERADVCAVPAAAVVAECMVAFELTKAFLSKFGADSLNDIKYSYQCYLDRIRKV